MAEKVRKTEVKITVLCSVREKRVNLPSLEFVVTFLINLLQYLGDLSQSFFQFLKKSICFLII